MRNRIYRWRRIRQLRRWIDNEYVHIAEIQAAIDRSEGQVMKISSSLLPFVRVGNAPLDEAQRKAWRRIGAYRAELGALGDAKHRRAR